MVRRSWQNDVVPFFVGDDLHVMTDLHEGSLEWGHVSAWAHWLYRNGEWTRLPNALQPGPEAFDEMGVWTGHIVHDGERLAALYTGQPGQSVCLAFSEDSGTNWRKEGVVLTKPLEYDPCFRDPCVWGEPGDWTMVVGASRLGCGVLPLYRSTNLRDWTFDGELFEDDGEAGVEFECPDVFAYEGRTVIVTSSYQTYLHLGRMEEGVFVREYLAPLGLPDCYAAKTAMRPDGRRFLVAWDKARGPDWAGTIRGPIPIEDVLD